MPIATAAPEALDAAPAGPANRILPGFVRIAQQGQNLCWAACCEMLFTYRRPGHGTTQCQMAATQHGQPRDTCCVNPIPGKCDQPAWPDDTYARNNIVFERQQSDIAFADLCAQIDRGDPVEVYYQWSPGGGHVAMVVGYFTDAGLDEVQVDDPYYAGGRMLFSHVRSAYGYGSWRVTYTKLR